MCNIFNVIEQRINFKYKFSITFYEYFFRFVLLLLYLYGTFYTPKRTLVQRTELLRYVGHKKRKIVFPLCIYIQRKMGKISCFHHVFFHTRKHPESNDMEIKMIILIQLFMTATIHFIQPSSCKFIVFYCRFIYNKSISQRKYERRAIKSRKIPYSIHQTTFSQKTKKSATLRQWLFLDKCV